MTMKRQAARVATLVTVAVLSLLPLLRSTPALSLPVFFCKTCIQHATELPSFASFNTGTVSFCLRPFVILG